MLFLRQLNYSSPVLEMAVRLQVHNFPQIELRGAICSATDFAGANHVIARSGKLATRRISVAT